MTTLDAGRAPGTNSGHGHAWPRPDGKRYRCGGPARCQQCRDDRRLLAQHVVRGVRVWRPDPATRFVDPDRPIRIGLRDTAAVYLTPDEAALVSAALNAAINTTETTR